MKKTLLTACSAVICFTTIAQVNRLSDADKSPNKSTEISTVNVDNSAKTSEIEVKSHTQTISKRAGEPQVVHDGTYYLSDIAKIDKHLDAIQLKANIINNNPEEKALAEANGWFEQMEETKMQLTTQKALLQEKLDKWTNSQKL